MEHRENDVENDSQEELSNEEGTIFLNMPNSIHGLRVRDTETGKFVPGSASHLASQFKRRNDARRG